MVQFFVPGLPQGKGRGRASSFGGRIRVYTPAKTVSYESTIALFGAQAMSGQEPMTGQVRLELAIAMPIAASWSKKKQEDARLGTIRPTSKPDLDNVLKCYGDGLNGIVWADDCQIVTAHVSKHYAAAPGVKVTVRPLP